MAPLTDSDRCAAYKNALENWSYDGFVTFTLTAQAKRWIHEELGYIKLREIGRLMHEYVAAGGEIDEVRETRPNWLHHEYHYDLRFMINNKLVYIETRLHYQPPFQPDEPVIEVVNVHQP